MPEDIQELIIQLNQLVVQLNQKGQYNEAMDLATQARDMAYQCVGKDHPLFAASLNNLAMVYKSKKAYAKAEPLYQEALTILRSTLGEGHPNVGAGLYNLATLYHSMGNYAKAESFYQEAFTILHAALGEEHSSVATCLYNLATLYHSMGNYAKAKPLYQQTLDSRRKTLGDAHPYIATILNGLAGLSVAMADYAKAEEFHQEALTILRTNLGDAHPLVANSLNNLAELYYEVGDYAKAEGLYQQALEIQRKALRESHPHIATNLHNLAELYHKVGDYAKAQELCQQALEIRHKTLGDAHPDVATSLSSLAGLYVAMADYNKAEELHEQALKVRRKALGDTHPDVANSLNNLAELYRKAGDYVKAEPLQQEALEIQRKTLGDVHPDVANSLNNLAALYVAIGDYAKAELLLQQALEIRSTALGKAHSKVADSLNNLAMLYVRLGDYARAEPLFQQALNIRRMALGEAHPKIATSLNGLAGLYKSMDDYARAEPLFQQALNIRRKALGEEHPDVAISLNTLASLYKSMGNYAKAEPLLQQALNVSRTALGKAHPQIAIHLNNLAALYIATDRIAESLTLIGQAIAIDDLIIGQVFSIGSENQRTAYLNTLQGHFNALMSFVSQNCSTAVVQMGLDLVLRRKALGAEALTAQRNAVLGGHYPNLESKLRDLTTLRMQIAEKTLAGPVREDPRVYRQALAKWNTQKELLEAELAHQIPEMNLAQQLQNADRQAVAKALPQGTILIEFVRFSVFDFKAVRARGELEWKASRYIAFVLSSEEPDSIQQFDLGETDPIDQLIARFRTTITGEVEANGLHYTEPVSQSIHSGQTPLPSEAEGNNSRHLSLGPVALRQKVDATGGIALRRAIFDPLLFALDDCKQLVLAPDGDLTRVPFEVLPTDDGKYLIDEYQISYVSTGRDVLRFGTTATIQSAPPLVIADPDFDFSSTSLPSSATGESRGKQTDGLDRSALHFRRLPGTRIEGERIAALLDVQPLLGEKALEARLKEHRSPRILHIATHGFFLPDQRHDPSKDPLELEIINKTIGRLDRFLEQHVENPLLRSGLAVVGANTWNHGGDLPPEAEDGLLTAEDVSGLDLLSTELVVLSACETGLGEVHIGEGVFGLRRAFVLAGAKTLVMSLWKVPDQETQELMIDFYHRILAGQPRADALRGAQLAMKAKRPYPYYWGAFICQGDPSPLSLQISKAAQAPKIDSDTDDGRRL